MWYSLCGILLVVISWSWCALIKLIQYGSYEQYYLSNYSTAPVLVGKHHYGTPTTVLIEFLLSEHWPDPILARTVVRALA